MVDSTHTGCIYGFRLHQTRLRLKSSFSTKMAQSCAGFDVNTNALLHGHDSWLHAAKFSGLPKLHVGRSSSEALRPPQLIYCGRVESFLVEVFHRRSQASKIGLSSATVEIILSYQACDTTTCLTSRFLYIFWVCICWAHRWLYKSFRSKVVRVQLPTLLE